MTFHQANPVRKTPFRPLAKVEFAIGGTLLLAGVLVVFLQRDGLRATFAGATGLAEGFSTVTSVVVAIAWAIWGITIIASGLRHIRDQVMPVNAPVDLTRDEVEGTLLRRQLKDYTLITDTGATMRLIRHAISEKLVWLSPVPATILRRFVAAIQRDGLLLVALLVGAFVSTLAPGAAGIWMLFQIFASPPVLLTIVVLGAAAAMRFVVLKMLVPEEQPRCERAEEITNLRGAGDPFALPAEVEHRAMEFRNLDQPNRGYKEGWGQSWAGRSAHEHVSSGAVKALVQDTGTVQGRLFIENQPVLQDAPPSKASSVLLAASIPFALIGFLSGAVGPIFLRGSTTFLALAQIGAWIIFSVLAYSTSKDCLGSARELMGRMRWTSTIVLLDVDGSFGRSEIKAGKAVSDSFETSNVVVRSDLQVKTYVASALSESADAASDRSLVAVIVDQNARDVQGMIANTLREFGERGVRVRGIDVADAGLAQTAQANLEYTKRREIARNVPVRELPSAPDAPLLGTPGATTTPLSAERVPRQCGSCGERNGPRAHTCGFCGAAL